MRVSFVPILCLVSIFVRAETVRLVPESYIVEQSVADAPISLDDAITHSLAFSAVNPDELPVEENKIRAIIDGFRATIDGTESERELAENALIYLHRNVLTRYSENQTLLGELLATGRFNCVSSAVLYAILMQSLHIDVRGVKTIDHAFCRIEADGVEYDVETTNEYGFDPGSKKEFTDSFGNITGYSYVSAGSYKKRKDISVRSLIAIILHNRISYLDKKEAFGEAVGLAVDSYAFAGDEDSREVLVGSIVNMGAWFNKRMQFEEGIDFFDRVIAMYETQTKYVELRDGLTHNHVVRLIDTKRHDAAETFVAARVETGAIGAQAAKEFRVYIALGRAQDAAKDSYEDALAIVTAAIRTHGTDKRLAEYRSSLANNWIASLVNGDKADEAIALIEKMKKAGDLDDAGHVKYMTIAVQKKAELIRAERGPLDSAAYIDLQMKTLGRSRDLVAVYNYMIESYEVAVHNNVAKLFNAGKYAEAETVLTAALEKLPASRKIKADLDRVRERLAQ